VVEAVGAVGLLVATTACSDSSVSVDPPDPDSRLEGELTFLRRAPNAPPLLTTDTSFVATRGEDVRVELFYAPDPGSGESRGERFLRFELEETSLLRYPDNHPRAGTLFADGDTVTITIRLEDDLLLGSFEPSGLQFDPNDPAELEFRYAEADDDYDGDGDSDPELEDDIDLWRQERPGDPWVKIGELQDVELDEIEAFLTSFTRYALAI
jgi:hypothetical protein